MSDLRTAAQQALEFLDAEFGWSPGEAPRIDNLRAALAQQAEPAQEPVAWMRPDNRVAEESYSRTQFSRGRDKPPIGTWTPLYTAPPQRHPLTEEAAALTAQRNALLEALKLARPYINPNTPYGYHAEVKADAAIKAVEGENHAKNL